MQCRICNRGSARSLGRIPDRSEFCGQHVSPAIPGGALWSCAGCQSMFRFPTLTASEYMALYRRLSCSVWEANKPCRYDIETIQSELSHHPGGRILDVGCYTGGFLAGLPSRFIKHGLEPSLAAAQVASAGGVNVLGSTLDDLPQDSKFEVVLVIDVIEHTLDVEAFLSACLSHVAEGGLLIISTGDPSNIFWRRVFKSAYWYNLYAEHVSFPSLEYYIQFSSRHGLAPPKRIRFRYLKIKFALRLRAMLRYAVLSILSKMHKASGGLPYFSRILGRKRDFSTLDLLGVFCDHQVVVFSQPFE